ncbi:uncharacterized protein C8Q71DRAFT_345439 [Rhodofomes roseus]|uniref:Metallo-beta-lactamase domain-containing protein n=1 Tax=Rhodofomes roseus TaxID=34475 RepID=A0ABQ8KSC3_9APHY|nr:uncharacterized protein C8Q71DRAFT_345439 [Rhodofomes roseus]KAH9841716.1 hypothetical protein C8Q71DRAFT_345439 [Rhodofomes roseus]
MPTYPWDTYTKEMREKYSCYGRAMWNPSPHLAAIHPDVDNAVDIGDVGRIERGQFHRLFNTISGFSHWTLPPTLVMLPQTEIEALVVEDNITESCLHSSSLLTLDIDGGATGGNVAAAGASFKCARKRGALLHLPEPESRSINASGTSARAQYSYASGKRLASNIILEEYVGRNIQSWHRFATGTARWRVDEADLVFVTGYFATERWGVATCTDHGVDATVSIRAGQGPLDISFSVSGSIATSSFFHTRCGPSNPRPGRQCIFLDLYRGASRASIFASKFLFFSKPFNALGVAGQPTTHDAARHRDGYELGNGFASITGAELGDDIPMTDEPNLYDEASEIPDPSVMLLGRILQHSNADVAVVSTHDLHYLQTRELEKLRAGRDRPVPPTVSHQQLDDWWHPTDIIVVPTSALRGNGL